MYIDNALNLAYSYAEKICNQAELDLVSDELIKIAGKTDEYTFRKDDMKYSYSETQNMLSKLNEKESIRKSKGVYYTPYEVSRNGDESVYLNRREAFWMKAYRENYPYCSNFKPPFPGKR